MKTSFSFFSYMFSFLFLEVVFPVLFFLLFSIIFKKIALFRGSFFRFSSYGRNKRKNRREVPIVKMTIFFCENSFFGPRWTNKHGLGMAH